MVYKMLFFSYCKNQLNLCDVYVLKKIYVGIENIYGLLFSSAFTLKKY